MRLGRALLVAVCVLGFGVGAEAESSDALIGRVRQAVAHNKLAPRPGCVGYVLTRASAPGLDRVDVDEVHDAACGGDPQVEHRLFSVFIDQTTRQMASDAGDPANGTLRVLAP